MLQHLHFLSTFEEVVCIQNLVLKQKVGRWGQWGVRITWLSALFPSPNLNYTRIINWNLKNLIATLYAQLCITHSLIKSRPFLLVHILFASESYENLN